MLRRTGPALLAGLLSLALASPALADQAMPDAVSGGQSTESGESQQVGSATVSENATPVDEAATTSGESGTPAEDLTPLANPELSLPLDRLAGADRYETSARISWSAFPGGAKTVYLARGDVYADAIAAGALGDGPVLLVPSCAGVPAAVAEEINRVDPEEVVALGGTGSICEDTLTAAANGRATNRLDGADRFDTAALIAARAFPGGADTVYLAEHREAADAVAGGTLTDGPILLVTNGSDTIPAPTKAAIETINPDNVVALGGRTVVTQQAVINAAGPRHTDRVSGADRYATSAAIAARAFPNGSSRTYLANGQAVADAVVGGSLTRGPVLLVRPNCKPLTDGVWQRLSTHAPDKVVALGGQASVCTEQLQTGGRMGVFSGMETGDTARLYDLLTKQRAVDPLKYVPADLVSWRNTSHKVRPEVRTMLEALFDDADSAGRGGLYVTSAYRSYATQQATYDYWVSVYGEQKASMLSAKPGHSEHQLGLAVDIAGPTCGGNCFGTSPEGKWVAANAHKYGFIIRYPKNGTSVTGYYYEPWHLRYVGPRAAWMMHVRDKVYWDTYQPTAVADAAP